MSLTDDDHDAKLTQLAREAHRNITGKTWLELSTREQTEFVAFARIVRDAERRRCLLVAENAVTQSVGRWPATMEDVRNEIAKGGRT